jgi:hypothetical protein
MCGAIADMSTNPPTGRQEIPTRLAYTRTETAKLLGVSPITVDRLTKRGQLKACRATRRPLYAATEIQRFLSED